MSEVVNDVQQEFWQPPASLEVASHTVLNDATALAETCLRCGAEFMIGSRFCHACGAHRPQRNAGTVTQSRVAPDFLADRLVWLQSVATGLSWPKLKFPTWLRYLHFHEIKRLIGLPTASLIAFFIGLGCVVATLSVSLFYKAQTLVEFQAIQLWRIEWLLAATASFVAGILLKKPSNRDND